MNYGEMNFSQIYDFEIYDSLINITSQLKVLSAECGYEKFMEEVKFKVDEFVENYCLEQEIEAFDFDRMPKDFARFYKYFDILLDII